MRLSVVSIGTGGRSDWSNDVCIKTLSVSLWNHQFLHSPGGLTWGKVSDFPFLVRRNFIQLCIHPLACRHGFRLALLYYINSNSQPSRVVILRGKHMGKREGVTWIKKLSNFSFYFIRALGRICDHWRCSPVYIKAPPSYIFQSLQFRPSEHRLTAEGVDEGSPLTLVLAFSSTFFFHF